jgi:sorbitol-specific phosphotransferase system component IIC
MVTLDDTVGFSAAVLSWVHLLNVVFPYVAAGEQVLVH